MADNSIVFQKIQKLVSSSKKESFKKPLPIQLDITFLFSEVMPFVKHLIGKVPHEKISTNRAVGAVSEFILDNCEACQKYLLSAFYIETHEPL